jgi:hypothetical protein
MLISNLTSLTEYSVQKHNNIRVILLGENHLPDTTCSRLSTQEKQKVFFNLNPAHPQSQPQTETRKLPPKISKTQQEKTVIDWAKAQFGPQDKALLELDSSLTHNGMVPQNSQIFRFCFSLLTYLKTNAAESCIEEVDLRTEFLIWIVYYQNDENKQNENKANAAIHVRRKCAELLNVLYTSNTLNKKLEAIHEKIGLPIKLCTALQNPNKLKKLMFLFLKSKVPFGKNSGLKNLFNDMLKQKKPKHQMHDIKAEIAKVVDYYIVLRLYYWLNSLDQLPPSLLIGQPQHKPTSKPLSQTFTRSVTRVHGPDQWWKSFSCSRKPNFNPAIPTTYWIYVGNWHTEHLINIINNYLSGLTFVNRTENSTSPCLIV